MVEETTASVETDVPEESEVEETEENDGANVSDEGRFQASIDAAHDAAETYWTRKQDFTSAKEDMRLAMIGIAEALVGIRETVVLADGTVDWTGKSQAYRNEAQKVFLVCVGGDPLKVSGFRNGSIKAKLSQALHARLKERGIDPVSLGLKPTDQIARTVANQREQRKAGQEAQEALAERNPESEDPIEVAEVANAAIARLTDMLEGMSSRPAESERLGKLIASIEKQAVLAKKTLAHLSVEPAKTGTEG